MDTRPLIGIRVIEMSHVVMGPMCGMVLAQLGAEVIKIEPLDGDPTRRLSGMGASFFPLFNAGKKSVALNLKTSAGMAALHQLLATADVFLDNFKDETISAMALDAATLKHQYPDLIVASHKGFLSGPYEARPALDEVVQMMTGLAVMTGSREHPLRVGASMNDMMGGLFGVIGILSLLFARKGGGVARELRVGLFENCLLAVAQHMIQYQLTGIEPPPLSQRVHAWPIYDRFLTSDGQPMFVAATTEGHWRAICGELGLQAWLSDPRLTTTNSRIEARDWTIPIVATAIGQLSKAELALKLEGNGVPFAPVNGPIDMFEDPHVQRPGGLIALHRSDKHALLSPSLPLEIEGSGLVEGLHIPDLGEHTVPVLLALGLGDDQIAACTQRNGP